jgi:predicted nucleotidyltransferase
MTDLASERASHTAALEKDLADLIQQLSRIPEVRKVILFGSYAAGRRDLFTDLDILVIMQSHLDFIARNVDLTGRLHSTVPLDLLVYTPEEIEKLKSRPFFRRAIQGGKILYEKRRTH